MVIINPQRAYAVRVTVVSVCVCVCPRLLQATRRPKKRFSVIYKRMKCKMAIFLKRLRSRATNWHSARPRAWPNPSISGSHAHDQRGMLTHLDLIRLLCELWRHKKPQRRACIVSRMLSTIMASPCQTLHELLAGDRGLTLIVQPIH